MPASPRRLEDASAGHRCSPVPASRLSGRGGLAERTCRAPLRRHFRVPTPYIVDLFKRIQECSLPIVARVNGHAMAGRLRILCACDMAHRRAHPRRHTGKQDRRDARMILPFMLACCRRQAAGAVRHRRAVSAHRPGDGLVHYVVPRRAGRQAGVGAQAHHRQRPPRCAGQQAFNATRDIFCVRP